MCVCGGCRGRGQCAAEWGQAPKETREAAAVPRGLLQGPGTKADAGCSSANRPRIHWTRWQIQVNKSPQFPPSPPATEMPPPRPVLPRPSARVYFPSPMAIE
ncbi:brain enriched myelin associated protein 1 [Phyllostomus discolor]|uniref:Brain enriched myelin associated protein 1 n=1 Tax=Phyllostomus discolor TaxID=89673 RepID=A0A833Z501_9CHIR|nr:brain enriched myelin associated protein 1 [Phyllostomus discolor]